jgi:hypothetical protein
MSEETGSGNTTSDDQLVLTGVVDYCTRLNHAMVLLREANKSSEEVDGKRYTTVAQRVEVFRRAFGLTASIETKVQYVDDDVVRVKATILIGDHYSSARTKIATGHAEEWRSSSDLNMTSALENAETSAIGRALACLGIHGGQFATADEVHAARAEAEAAKTTEAASVLTPEEVADAIQRINACTTEESLSETYVQLSPARKAITRQLMEARLRALRSAQKSGSEPEKAASPPPPSEPRRALRQPRARSSGED